MKTRLRLALVLLALLASLEAIADPEDSWNILLGTSFTRDSNLFRLPSGSALSDEVIGTYAGLKVNKVYSLQHFVVDALITDYKFKNFDYLDNIGKKLDAAWLWSLTPRLHGNLSTNYSEGLTNYTDYRPGTNVTQTRRNVRTTNTERFDLEWGAWGRVHLLGGVKRFEQKNTALVFEADNYTARTVEYGAKYVFPSSSEFALVGRSINGEYQNRVFTGVTGRDNGFSERDVELRFVWAASDQSRFSGNLGHISREHDHTSSPNYSGTVGALHYSLDVTGKVKLLLNASRDLRSYQDTFSTYYQVDSFSASPVWQVLAKTSVRAQYSYEKRDYRGPGAITTVLPGYSGYEDTIRNTSLSVDWQPLRTVTLSSSLQRATRDSTFQFSRRDYVTNSLYLSANLAF